MTQIVIARAQRAARIFLAAKQAKREASAPVIQRRSGYLRVEVGGPAHLYTREIPKAAVIVGIVTTAVGEVGALVRLRNGSYAMVNNGSARLLHNRDVVGAMLDAWPPARSVKRAP